MSLGPRPFVEEIARDLPVGKALDLACGNGRNAIWLADRGWDVTAVDRVPDVVHPGVRVVTADLETHEYKIEASAWDLIVVSYYLQPDLFPSILRGLTAQGVAILIVHLFEPGHEASRFSLHPGELRQYFRGAKSIAYREGKPTPDSRAVAQIAVRR